MLKDKHFNQTAYRILLLLQWLGESPLSLDEINARLLSTPNIGRTFSQDSLGLHINTLKALGCKISRPSKTNQYRYHLTYFPFNSFLTSQDLNTLEEATEKAQNHLNYRDFIHFYRFLKKMFHYAGNLNRQSMENSLMATLRSHPLDHLLPMVDKLEPLCEARTPIAVNYQSPTKGAYVIPFLPHHLMHQQGTLYLAGYRQKRNTQSMLRLDRINSITAQPTEAVEGFPSTADLTPNQYELRILHCSLDQYEPLGQGDRVTQDPDHPAHLRVQLFTDNEFLLKQKLLSTHYEYQILSPERFSGHLQETLQQMRQLYQ